MSDPADESIFLNRATARRRGIHLDTLLGPRYFKLFFDCYLPSTIAVTPVILVQAASYCWPDALGACHHSAAHLWGGITPSSSDVHLAVAANCRTKRKGIKTHRYADLPQLARCAGVTATTPEQTFLDLAGSLDLVDLVILGDSLIKRDRTTIRELREVASRATGRGNRMARRAAELVRDAVDSPNETRLRLLMVLAGLSEPSVNAAIRDADGALRRRLDLAYEDARLAIEYDGRHHVTREEQWQKDVLRREELEAQGWRFVIITSVDIYSRPGQTLARITAAMRLQGMIVPRMREAWRPYFAPHSKTWAA